MRSLENAGVWYLAFKGAFSSKFRACLTLLGIAVGVFALTAMGSMALHFHKMANRFFALIGDKIFIRERSGFFGAGALDEEELLSLSKIPGISEVVPVTVARLRSQEVVVFGLPQIAVGIPLSKISLLYKEVPLLWGTWPKNSGECVLGADVSEEKKERPAYFSYQGKAFRVSGVMARTNGPEDREMIVSLEELSNLLGRKELVSYGLLLPKDPREIPGLVYRISKEHSHWEVFSPEVLMGEIRKSQRLWDVLTLGISFLAFCAGGIGILTITMMAVQQRVAEIAIAKAMGASRHQIFLIFLLEALILSILGSAAGLALGLFFISQANHWLAREGVLLFEPSVQVVFFALLLALALSLLGGLYPAWYGAKIKPSEFLR